MKTWSKIGIGLGATALLIGIGSFAVHQARKGIVVVQTGKVTREDLASIVSASGEIKPKTYVNIGANAFGKIVKLYVKEGERVKKGQMLAQIENVQPASDVAAMKASLQSAQTDYVASQAALNSRLPSARSAEVSRRQEGSTFRKVYLTKWRSAMLHKE